MTTQARPKLDASSAAFLRALQDAAPLDWSAEQIKTTRERLKASQQQCFNNAARIPISTQLVQTVGENGSVRMSVKSPENIESATPVVLFIHGGGWISGDLESHAPFVDRVVAASRATVVSVDYRLSPEYRFPSGLEDCWAALQWVSKRYDQPVAVMGDSAGGNLAAALCQLCRDRGLPVSQQILICPVTDPGNFTTDSRKKYGGGEYLLSNREMQQMIEHYASSSDDIANPLFSPLRVESANGLPSTLLITAECDMLLDEGKAYADRLAQSGVLVRYQMFEGTVHDFAVFGDAIPKSDEAIQLIATSLN